MMGDENRDTMGVESHNNSSRNITIQNLKSFYSKMI